jgi:hypothetical protein
MTPQQVADLQVPAASHPPAAGICTPLLETQHCPLHSIVKQHEQAQDDTFSSDSLVTTERVRNFLI